MLLFDGHLQQRCSMTNPVLLWAFWVPFILIFTSINTHLASSKCLEDQQSLLLQLKKTLQFNQSKSRKLVNWNQTSDCCQWNGVQCNDSTGHVIGIDLCGESITSSNDNLGSLFSLQFLQSLNLANNSFSNAEIPSGIRKLSGLTYLNFSNTGFSGQVPPEISQLVKLEIIDFSSLSYFGFSPLKLENPSLAMLIQNLTTIRELHLDGVVISANGSEWCKAVSSSLPNLQVLSLSNCNLSGEVNPSLGKLHSLSVIRLDNNDLSAPVPDFIANFRNLTLLKLSSCELKGVFPQKILQVPTLKNLDLSYNRLLQGTLPEFPENRSLEALVLSFTTFSGSIPDSIGKLKQLRRIELTNCSFSGPIPPSMTSLYQLEYVDFSSNKFSGPIPSFSSTKNIKYLSLGNNILNGTLASTDWAKLSSLANLDLSTNLLNGTIATTLFSLSSLQKIQLSQNGFSGRLEEFSNISDSILETVDLANNKLEGEVPKSLFALKGLKVLSLSFNNFTGSLKLNVIQHLKNLSTLELSQNSLLVDSIDNTTNLSSFPQLNTLKLGSCNLGVLPEFLKNQSRLQFLDLSDNRIQGTIHKWIWTVGNGSLTYLNLSCNNFVDIEQPLPNNPYLSVLDLNSNRLRGEIPTLSAPSMVYLDYANNNFTSINPNITNLSFTRFLSLSRNNISGGIPAALCNASFLQVLDLSYNFLSGTIPDCFGELIRTLEVLNLRKNYLNGTLLDVFTGDCNLNTIDIGQNNLHGQLPKSMANCKQLEVLDLGENYLHDTFPRWLRNLSNLRVLVLRGNQLYGSIACPPSNRTWPVLQIVDLASNNFKGELKAECFSNLTALMAGENSSQSATSQLQYSILPFDNINYLNMLVVTLKGTEIMLQKIIALFRIIDLSANQFQGNIPDVIGDLSALISLNLSHNALSGSIPSSIGNLKMLESLDLSNNNLIGNIPQQLGEIPFLALLNLSHNHLVGKIPNGPQLQTFDRNSFADNKGLCGSPLPNCSPPAPANKASVGDKESNRKTTFDWQFILLGTGIGTGAGLVIAPFMVWKKGRKWYDKQVNKLALEILWACGFRYASLEEVSPGLEEDIGHQLFKITGDGEDTDEDEIENIRLPFCLFCSKLDKERRRVIHNPSCTCQGLSSIASSCSDSS